jgi:thiol-disulfide isomerase/thioredoxin
LRNWLLRVAGLVAIVGVGVGIAFGLGIIGDDDRETIEADDGNTIVIDVANIVGRDEEEVVVGEGDERKFEIRKLHDDRTEEIEQIGVEVGDLAPNFSASNFEGERFQLSDFRGKVVFLNFWASWCGPCRAEMPAMQDLLAQYGYDLVIIAANNQEAYRPAKSFIDDLGVDYTEFALDPSGEIVDAYKVFTMPTSYFIDAEGRISAVHLGQITFEEMVERFEEARSGSGGRLDLNEEDLLQRTGHGPACEPRGLTGDNAAHG